MFGKRKGPGRPFGHSSDCKIAKADPGVKIPWSEIRRGVWEARCSCGVEHYYDPVADGREKLDPLDPATARHGGGCVLRDASDPALVRAALKVTEKDGYWWVECNACEFAWQVPFFAPESVALEA
jgi:hypothetical protein